MEQRTAFGCLIVLTYTVYMSAHVIQGTLAPNGIILSFVVGAVCALIGVKVGAQRAKEHLLPIEYPEE